MKLFLGAILSAGSAMTLTLVLVSWLDPSPIEGIAIGASVGLACGAVVAVCMDWLDGA